MLANKKMSALLVALLFSSAAWGGLGGIAVRSNLGEALRADIDLTGSPDEEMVRVGLAPIDTFRDLQVDYSPALSSLRFALAYRANGKPYVRVMSVQPISEPYLRFVVEAKTVSGRSIREYTVLLDPAEYQGKSSASERVTRPPESVRTPPPLRTPLPAVAEAPSLPEFVTVKRGQTLAQVARQVRGDGASLRQTMAALVLANPNAFVEGDPATLKTGARLKVPSPASARALRPARVAQVLDGRAASVPAKPVAAPAAQALPAPVAVPPSQPVLKVEPPDATDAQLKAAQAKIQQLEEQLKALQAASVPKAEAPPLALPASAPHAAASAPLAASAPQASAPAVKPPVKPHIVVEPPVEEPSLLDEAMAYLPLLAGGAAAVLAGVAAILFLRRRQAARKPAAEQAGASIMGANTVGRVAAGDDAAGNTFLADFTRTGMTGMDSGEVDPIAEAEVYLAYGRDQQAEDILKDALLKDPTRHEVRMKLLDLYASRQDRAAFEAQARELHAALDGKGALWSRAAALGLSIDPGNPLYASEEPAPMAAAAAPLAAAAVIDLDSELMGEPEAPQALPQEAFIEPEAIDIEDDDPLRNALFGNDAPEVPAPALDLDSLLQADPVPAVEPVEHDDKHMLDFDFNLDTPEEAAAKPEAQAGDAFDFDMSSLESLGGDEPAPAAPSLDGMSLSEDPLSTKLDLARVYLDMGDKEGAREVLEELAAEAEGSLKAEAQALLASL